METIPTSPQRDPLAELAALGLTVVPMEPGLADALVTFHGSLSSGSIRRRFFTMHPRLTDGEIHRFTNVDHDQREALVALDAEGQIAAVARFDRVSPGSTTAEVAFVVADRLQHLGIGTAMFELLVERALAVGIHRVVADTLAENRPMQRVFAHSGYPCARYLEGGIVHVELALDDEGRRDPP